MIISFPLLIGLWGCNTKNEPHSAHTKFKRSFYISIQIHTIEARLWPNFSWIHINQDRVKPSMFPVPRFWWSIDGASLYSIVMPMKRSQMSNAWKGVWVATLPTPPTEVTENGVTTTMLLRPYNC